MSPALTAAGFAIAFFLALAGCASLRAFALRRMLLDHPNERSLHSVPTPRLGGVAIAVASWLALLAVHALQRTGPDRFERAWLLTSLPIFLLGLIDDLRPLRAGTRLLLQLACAGLFCALAGVPRGVSVLAPAVLALPPPLSLALWSVFIVGVLNIFNFMDGLDGLAATQSLGAALGLGGAFALVHQPALALLCGVLASASLGFLFHNFPPAKIFMGDAGSTFLGFSFAVLAATGTELSPAVPIPVFLLALAPFLLDGTFTLLRRALRGEPIWKAHRTHLYQRAVLQGRTHEAVLARYALWVAGGGVAAVLAARAGPALLIGLALAMTGCLGLVRRWASRPAASAE